MHRRLDAAEALTNACVGLLVSWGVTYWMLPLWGLAPSVGASAGITFMYFWVSFARAWILRAVFRRIGGG